MKLLTSTSSFHMLDTEFLINNNIYTRDFKEKPLTQAYSYSNGKTIDTHYKNPMLFNPIITTYTALGTTRWKAYTGMIYNNIKYTFYDGIAKSSDTSEMYDYDAFRYWTDDTYTNMSSINPTIRGRAFALGNYTYSNGAPNSASYYQMPKWMGLSIGCMPGNNKSPLMIYSAGNSGTYFYHNNDINVKLLNTDETHDLVALNMWQGCGYASAASTFTSGNFTGVTESDFFDNTTYKSTNDLKLFDFNVGLTVQKYTKTVGDSKPWYTDCYNGSSYKTYVGHLNSTPSNMLSNTFFVYRLDPSNYKNDTTGAGLWKIIVDEENKTYTTYRLTSTDSTYNLPYQWVNLNQYQDLVKMGRGYKLEYKKVGDKSYLTLIIDNVTSDTLAGLYTYEIDETNNTFTFIDRTLVYNNQIMNYYLIDDTTMVTTSYVGYEIFKFDTTTGKWVKSCGKTLDLWALVYDEDSNALWYADRSNNIYMDKISLAMSADWGWEDTSLVWEGENIDTNIYLGCKNYNSEYIATSVTLTLTGNAQFTSNEQKEITVTTSTTGNIDIPVTITGDGNVTCSAKVAIS